MAIMRRAKIAELKNNLSRYLDHVKAGGTVLILDRDRPVARIVPLSTQDAEKRTERRLDELERLGIIRRGKGSMRDWLRKHRPVKLPGGRSLVEDLIEERRSGW